MTPEQARDWKATVEWSALDRRPDRAMLEAVDAELKLVTAQRDALLEALRLAKELSELARIPNAEYFADKHNTALRRMLVAIASVEGAA